MRPIDSKVRLRFLGAAQTVAGSKYLLTYNGRKIMIDGDSTKK